MSTAENLSSEDAALAEELCGALMNAQLRGDYAYYARQLVASGWTKRPPPPSGENPRCEELSQTTPHLRCAKIAGHPGPHAILGVEWGGEGATAWEVTPALSHAVELLREELSQGLDRLRELEKRFTLHRHSVVVGMPL